MLDYAKVLRSLATENNELRITNHRLQKEVGLAVCLFYIVLCCVYVGL